MEAIIEHWALNTKRRGSPDWVRSHGFDFSVEGLSMAAKERIDHKEEAAYCPTMR
jgi:hypothetical protein